MEKTRPKHLDLPKIRLPIPGIVSILHRISGILLFIAIPLVLAFLQGSLSNAADFESFKACVAHPLVKLILLGLLWAFLHHAIAGIRFLALDIHKGLELQTARLTAKLVIVFSLALTVIIGGVLW